MFDESKLPVIFRTKLPENLEKIKNTPCSPEDYDYPVHLYLQKHDVRIDENGSDIIQFLHGKNILITGATGFLGKLLIEKLLRCCKDIGTIYIIIRTKKGKDAQKRSEELLDNLIFYRLSEIYPDYKKKVVGISGDFMEPGLGLSEESRNLIAEKVNIIYHVAATVRFDEKIKVAVTVNIKGTQEIIKIARSCKNLDVFTYVSTAFSNCQVSHIKEEFYEPVMDPYQLIEVTDKLSNKVLDNITPGLLGEMPNTYAFTKQIAESIIKREAIGLPVCIQRPSIVIATANEPIRSWVDNIFGPVGLIQGAALGLVHVMIGNPDGRADFVPADYVINNCIAASYKTATDRSSTVPQIYNYTCPKVNQLRWRNLVASGVQGEKAGSKEVLWKYFFVFTGNYYFYFMLHFLFHIVPGYIVDFLALRLGRKPMLGKIYKKIEKFINALAYFTLNEWSFDSDNTEVLWKTLNDKDKQNFMFNIKQLNWQTYFDTYIVCLREFLLADSLDNIEEGRSVYKKKWVIHYASLSVIIGVTLYLFLNTAFWFIPVGIICLALYYKYDQVKSSNIITDINNGL